MNRLAVVGIAGIGLALAGCDLVFDVTAVPVPPFYGQVVMDPTGDLDEDGDPNASDLCALIPKTEIGANTDSDGDRVGDACDPDPDVTGNCMVLFDSMDAGLSPHWRWEGQQVENITDQYGGYLHIPFGEESFVYLDTELTLQSVYITGYVHNGANSGGARNAVEVFVDGRRDPKLSGTACAIDGTQTGSSVAIIQVTEGNDVVRTSKPLGSLLVGAGTNVDELEWTAAGCRAHISDTNTDLDSTVTVPPPAPGTFTLRLVHAGFDVFSLAGYGRGCTQ